MKVAISTDQGHVSAHFGRCPSYTIVEIEKGQILKQEEFQILAISLVFYLNICLK